MLHAFLSTAYFPLRFSALFGHHLPVSKLSGRITEIEREIAARVRRVRKDRWLSQAKFAAALGEPLDRIAHIEYARTPLTVAVADKIADVFGISLKWLKTGRGKMVPSNGRFSVFAPEIKPNTLLSSADVDRVEREYLKTRSYNVLGIEALIYKATHLPKGEKQKTLIAGLHAYVDEAFDNLPHAGREKLLALLHCTIEKFEHDWHNGEHDTPGQNLSMEPLAIPKDQPFDLFKIREQQELHLTHVSTASTSGDVNQWTMLKARLQKATGKPGRKSMLAGALNVDLTQISRWLSKSGPEPGADYALKMLQWVQEREQRQT